MDAWDEHWSDFASSASANPAQALRRRLVLDALALDRAPGPVRVLDLGCGTGELLRDLGRARPDAELVGIDASEAAIALAASRTPRARFHRRDLTVPAPPPTELLGFATHAVCSEVLEHLDEPVAALRGARGFLAPAARLVVTVPGGPRSAFDRHIGHRRHHSRRSLARILEEAGFVDVRVEGEGFPFFNLYRWMVVARGERLIRDVAGDAPPLSARLAMRAFAALFAVRVPASPFGWQLVGTATA